MELAFVTPTLGRIPELEKLLNSLEGHLQDRDECIVVAQGNVEKVKALVAERAHAGLSVRCIESPRGASLGRNWGAREVASSNPLLVFPNDSNWFAPETIIELRALPESFVIGSMTMVDSAGPRFTLPMPSVPIDRWNVWKVLEATLLVRKEFFLSAGGFNEALGTGASTPWQAGEATDFLLQTSVLHPESFEWLPSSVAVAGVPEASHLGSRARRTKIRAYGRGIGRVIGRHNYPILWKLAFVAAGLVVGLRSTTYSISDGPWAFIGRLEGIWGRTFGSTNLKAVSR